MSHSLFEPCELATLSALSIPAYDPRVLERITFLTSLCQMFMTKIDITSNLTTKSKECIYTWLDRRLLCCNNNNINNTIYTKKKKKCCPTLSSQLLPSCYLLLNLPFSHVFPSLQILLPLYILLPALSREPVEIK